MFTLDAAGRPAAKPAVTADTGNVPFAVSFDAGGHLAVAEAGANAAATFTVHRDGTLGLIDRAATGQAFTCWVVGDAAAFYASNADSGTLSGYGDDGSGTLRPLGSTAADAGTVDAGVPPAGTTSTLRPAPRASWTSTASAPAAH